MLPKSNQRKGLALEPLIPARMSLATQVPICTAGPAMPGSGLASAVWL